MDKLISIFNILEYIVYIYFLACSVHLLLFSVSSHFYRENISPSKGKKYTRRYAILIPGYKEDKVIVDAVKQNLAQNFPKELFDIYVLADSFSPETLNMLSKENVSILEMKFDNSTKAKSLNSAIKRIEKVYDVLVILDADNIADPDFLPIVDHYFDKGYKAVQGHRKAKNNNSKVAALDGLSEEINNSIFRKGHVALGFSSALIGSGMAFDWEVFCKIFPQISSVGEDKEFDIKLMENRIKIAYSNSAIVYDEKISNMEAMENQRSRWIAAQFEMFSKYFLGGVLGILKGNTDLFVKTLHQVILPRVMMIGIFVLLIAVYAIPFFIPSIDRYFAISVYQYIAAFSCLFLALLLAIPKELFNKELFIAIVLLPKIILTFVKSFIKSKKSKDTFVHTEHGA